MLQISQKRASMSLRFRPHVFNLCAFSACAIFVFISGRTEGIELQSAAFGKHQNKHKLSCFKCGQHNRLLLLKQKMPKNGEYYLLKVRKEHLFLQTRQFCSCEKMCTMYSTGHSLREVGLLGYIRTSLTLKSLALSLHCCFSLLARWVSFILINLLKTASQVCHNMTYCGIIVW